MSVSMVGKLVAVQIGGESSHDVRQNKPLETLRIIGVRPTGGIVFKTSFCLVFGHWDNSGGSEA